MVEINYQNLPPQEGFKIDVGQLGGYDLHPEGEEYEHDDDEPRFEVTTRPFASNDYHIAYLEGDPGATIPWHTHTPIMYQTYIPLQGRVEVSYRDNDGEVHTTEAEPDEIVYLPAGAHNRVRAVGDERVRVYVIERETLIPRVEHLVGDAAGLYDPKNDPEHGLEIDSLRGNVLEVDDAAVERY